MKWIPGLVLMAFLFASCDNELVVTDKWKDIPVVWGFLSKSDTAHYIRVEKAFLDPTTSAYTIAQIPDSLYYPNPVVTLKRISSGQVFTLTRVNGDLEGYPRDTGDFAQSPNYLYKIKASQLNLTIGDTYEFSLKRNDFTDPVVAQTIILPKPVLRSPVPGSIVPFKSNANFTFNWNEIPDAGLFDLHVILHYSERSPETGNFYVPLQIDWVVARNLVKREITIDGAEFYNTLKANIEENINATRLFDSLDIVVWCAGKELYEFVKITNANTGITGTQDIPTFSNLSEGLGIFSSRNVARYTGFDITTQTLDSLRNGSITGHLNFN